MIRIHQVQGAGGAATEVQQAVGHGIPSQFVVFFEGDQISDDDTKELLGEARWSPSAHLSAVAKRVGSGTHCALVMPTSVAAGGQAVFSAFLPATTATGEPLGFKPQGYKAATHLHSILAACCGGCVVEPAGEQASAAAAPPGAAPGAVGTAGPGPLPAELHLIGFSKGAVVVNQLLTELAWYEEALQRGAAAAGGVPAAGAAAGAVAWGGAAGAAAGAPAPAGGPPQVLRPSSLGAAGAQLPPDSARRVLDAVRAAHFLDAGLNSRGVHVTDPQVTAMLGARHLRLPLDVHLHGTPRQWGDRRRPWISQEKDRFAALLQASGVPCRVLGYYAGQPATLKQHFDVIGDFELGGLGEGGAAGC